MKKLQRGFTILEFSLGLAILSVVILIIGMTISTLLMNYNEPTSQQVLLHQVQNSSYHMIRDINMSSNITLGDQNGFPLTVVIPVNQDQGNDYTVDYFFDGDKLKRQQFDSEEVLTAENVIADYVDTGNTTFESPYTGFYAFNIRVTWKGESVTGYYEAERRLSLD